MFKIGIDVGSTTVKVVVLDEQGNSLFSRYKRHHAKAGEVVASLLKELLEEKGDADVSVCITGSVGMGMSERYSLPFIKADVTSPRAIQTGARLGHQAASSLLWRTADIHPGSSQGFCGVSSFTGK